MRLLLAEVQQRGCLLTFLVVDPILICPNLRSSHLDTSTKSCPLWLPLYQDTLSPTVVGIRLDPYVVCKQNQRCGTNDDVLMSKLMDLSDFRRRRENHGHTYHPSSSPTLPLSLSSSFLIPIPSYESSSTPGVSHSLSPSNIISATSSSRSGRVGWRRRHCFREACRRRLPLRTM